MTNLIDCIQKKLAENEFFFSIEIFPPKSEDELNDLIRSLELFLSDFKPLFCDITYHSHSQKPIEDQCSSFSIAAQLIENSIIQPVLHLTCCNRSKVQSIALLVKAKELNIRNLFLLRGDTASEALTGDSKDDQLNFAHEFVSLTREIFGSYFTISVAGYPGKHPEAQSLEEDISYLKRKVDSGADFILSQIVFDADDFIDFVVKCRSYGITKPIVAGILPVDSIAAARRIAQLCKVNLPDALIECLEQANIDASVNYFVDLCQKIIHSNATSGIHFYTMNDFALLKAILSKLAK